MQLLLTHTPPIPSTPLPPPTISLPSRRFLSVPRSDRSVLRRNLQLCFLSAAPDHKHRLNVTVLASSAEATATGDGERWLLEPVGDGDSRHIGFKVPMPDAFEISSSDVTVGRVPEKADIVIPVATVSAMHARIQKKGGDLLVTDLNSTNGTFIDEKRLSPGVTAKVPPGRYITFGDTNLAIFRVSKLKTEAIAEPGNGEVGDNEVKTKTED